jgi:serine/threonine protein kinase/Tfp pilus assembly protein PilF
MATQCPKCNFDNPETASFCADCGTQLEPTNDIPSITKTLETPLQRLTKGTLFANRYEILEKLGKGGMGEVYRVKDKKLDEEMALKVLRPEIAVHEGTIERFKNELKFARKITHRNVCRMYDLNEEGDTPFITMEYVDGENLKSLIKRKEKLSAKETIALAKQVCEGLIEAHNLDVIHRDLKPQNIMVDDKGVAKVMDFGIARSVEAAGVTQTGVMIGTPDYLSPEQAEGEETDHRSDIYSLGVILYEMITGDVPFKGETALSVAMKHKSQFPLNPKILNPDISEDLSRLILICMEKDKERRYQAAEALLNDLHNIEDGLPLGTKIRPRRETFTRTLIRKKLIIPALVVALAIIAILIWQFLPQRGEGPITSNKPSIVVLPFDDLSPLKNQEHICEGLAETLITALSQIENLFVPARTSAFSFQGREKNYQEIGERLNVETVLKGSIQKSGQVLRITARIINTSDDSLLWSETYDGEEQDIFEIQDQISMEIVDNLKIELLGEEKVRLVKQYTKNAEAYNLYLKGIYFLNRFHIGDSDKAFECFEQALEKDPYYAKAYVGIARCHYLLGEYRNLRPKDYFPKAKMAIEKALEIEDGLAEAHVILGWIKWGFDWDWPAAEDEFKLAIELSPNLANAHSEYSRYLKSMGRNNEAIAEAKIAKELDPLSFRIGYVLGGVLKRARQYDQAIEEYKRILDMDPNYSLARVQLIKTYREKGMYDEATGEFKKLGELSRTAQLKAELAQIYALSKNEKEAERILVNLINLSKERYASPSRIAGIYAGLGQNDQAFDWLERAYEERDPGLIKIKTDPIFDNLSSDPRYKILLNKLNLN